MISIGIPTYNQADTLGETIESFINQTLAPLEIVVSDNWCTDNTQEILKRYKGMIKVVKPARHLSMMENWNFLVSHLKGEWFSLMSSDDIALPNFVLDISRAISQNTDAVLIRGPYIAIDGNGFEVDRRTAIYAAKKRDFPDNFYEQIWGTKTSFAAFCVKKEAFESLGFNENLTYAGDYALWLRLSPMGSFITTEKCISKYRVDYRQDISAHRSKAIINDSVLIKTQIIPSIRNNWITCAMLSVTVFRYIRWLEKNVRSDCTKDFIDKLNELEQLKGTFLKRGLGLILNKLYRIRTIK